MIQSLRVFGAIVILSTMAIVQAIQAQDFFEQGDYVRAYHSAIQEGDVAMASRAVWAHCAFKDPQNAVWISRGLKVTRLAIKKDPQNVELYIHLGSMIGNTAELKGVSVEGFEMAQESKKALEKAIEISPHHPRALMQLARWHSGAYIRGGRLAGGRPEKARSLATKALKLNSKDTTMLVDVAIVLAELKDPRASEFLKRALAIPPKNAVERDWQRLGEKIVQDLVK